MHSSFKIGQGFDLNWLHWSMYFGCTEDAPQVSLFKDFLISVIVERGSEQNPRGRSDVSREGHNQDQKSFKDLIAVRSRQ